MLWKRIAAGSVLAAAILGGCDEHPAKPRPEPVPIPPEDPSALVQTLADAYRNLDFDAYVDLFPEDSEAPFLFILSEPLPTGQRNWDRNEELRIHRRMFEPENVLPGETPVPQDLRLDAIAIALTQVTEWTERADLYRSPSDSTGLDPARWRAVEAEYQADVLWDTQTDTDYRIDAREAFVVIEDLMKASGEPRKFLLYRWEDLGRARRVVSSSSEASWTGLKQIYR